jgi:UDP-glucuronate decarboxylase
LACPASPVQYQRNPVRTIRTSFLGALNCLELATKKNIKVLQSSTSEVYGDPAISPQTEEYWGNVNPIGIRSCYDEGKRAAETLFFDFYREYGTKIKVARIFNTYGPTMAFDDGRVVSNFIVQALKDRDLTIYGTGDQTRSFCYVDDLISGMIELFNSEHHIVGPINLGNPREFSMLELAELVVKLTGSRSRLAYEKLPGDDPKQRCPDITQARMSLGWEPTVDLIHGLQQTIDDFKERMLEEKS